MKNVFSKMQPALLLAPLAALAFAASIALPGQSQTALPVGGHWIASGANLYNSNSGNVGVGISSPVAKLDVRGASVNYYGVVNGQQDGGNVFGAGVYGKSTLTHGKGVIGEADGAAAYAVWGRTTLGTGVVGESASNAGVAGFSSSGPGVYGSSQTGFAGDFAGKVRMNGFTLVGNGVAAGRVLTCDATGLGTWQPAPGLALPYAGSAASTGAVFQVTNSSTALEPAAAIKGISNTAYGVMGQTTTGFGVYGYATDQVNGWAGWFEGRLRCRLLRVSGGLDVAEPFAVRKEDAARPGMVVCIDAEKTGELRLASKAYDRAVAGVISGAGGVNPGMVLEQKGVAEMAGKYPVALTGRVWAHADADAGGPIEPGDLLTTSGTPGHAMKVSDFARANGCILGKAMSSLKSGKGLVLVLVGLQ